MKTKYKFRPPFNPSIEMGVMISTGGVSKYGRKHGMAALGQLMHELIEASKQQDRKKLLSLPIVASVVVRPAQERSGEA